MDQLLLQKIIESLIFVADKPLTLKQIHEVCPQAENAEIKAALTALQERYNNSEHGIQINEVAGGFQFVTNPECAEYVKELYKTKKVFRLSGPALETLAIIAYKQPVTRSEIEFIRGVNVDGVIKTLEERNLIKEKGRKEIPGRPILYGTAEEFLHYFGLKSIEDLPSMEEFEATLLEKNNMAEPEEGVSDSELSAPVPADSSSSDQAEGSLSENAQEAAAPEIAEEDSAPQDILPETGEASDERDEHSQITQSN